METVRVYDIILDTSHPAYEFPNDIGTVYYDELDDRRSAEDSGCEDRICGDTRRARPYHMNMIHFPLKNEIIHIIPSINKNYYKDLTSTDYYLPPLSVNSLITQNTFPNIITEKGEYPIGNYYKENLFIKRLQPYEGDMILQGRFGNSIRFGSIIDNDKILNFNNWSSTGSIGNPITIISNGQPDRKYNNKGYHVEDVNTTKSSIWLCNNQQIDNFEVASKYKASYYYDQNMLTTESPERLNNDIPDEATEEIQLSEPISNTIEENEMLNEDITYDTSPTENQTISVGDILTLPTQYRPPNGLDSISPSYLNEKIGEFTRLQNIYSVIAEENGINNYPGADILSDDTLTDDFIWGNLQKLHTNCVVPILETFGTENIRITSAYRSKELNDNIGGFDNSQHEKGYAIDLISLDHSSAVLFNWCKTYLPSWYQLIWEYPERGNFNNNSSEFSWVHISYNEENNPKIVSIASEIESIHQEYKENGDEKIYRIGKYTHNITGLADENLL